MESQETLVNPSPPARYHFSSDSVKNTRIFSSTGSPASPTYTITTDNKAEKRTEVRNARGDVVAVWTRKDLLSDTIAWAGRYGGKSTPVNKWLKKVDGADGLPVHALTTPFGPILFHSSLKHRVAAYLPSTFASTSSIGEAQPIAYLTPRAQGCNPALVLSTPAQAEDIRDEIVLAILVLEHKLRTSDMAAVNVIAGSSSKQGRLRDIMSRRSNDVRFTVVGDQVDCFLF